MGVEALWSDFTNSRTPPPYSASAQGWRAWSGVHRSTFLTPLIDCIFYPSLESGCSISWPGPDLMSCKTRADDIFFYITGCLTLVSPNWIDIRLCEFSSITGNSPQQFQFCLSRCQSLAEDQLPRIQQAVQAIISSQTATGLPLASFKLYICPRHDTLSQHCSSEELVTRQLALDPEDFVKRIMANFV